MSISAIIATLIVLGVIRFSGMLLPKKGSSARELVNETAAATWSPPTTELTLREMEDSDLIVLNLIYEASDTPLKSVRLIRVAQRGNLLSTTFPEELVECGAASLLYHITQMRLERGELDITPAAIIGHLTPTR